VYRIFDQQSTVYHQNMRRILNACFPGLAFSDQMRKTWIADAYLCSAPKEGGNVPAASWRTSARDYLMPQLQLLRDRVIVALGSKAQQRLKVYDGQFLRAGSAAPPGSNFRGARESWNQIPEHVRLKR